MHGAVLNACRLTASTWYPTYSGEGRNQPPDEQVNLRQSPFSMCRAWEQFSPSCLKRTLSKTEDQRNRMDTKFHVAGTQEGQSITFSKWRSYGLITVAWGAKPEQQKYITQCPWGESEHDSVSSITIQRVIRWRIQIIWKGSRSQFTSF